MTVQRRVDGTIDGAVEYHLRYSVRTSVLADPLVAEFRAIDMLASPGAPSQGTFLAVSGAVRAYGRAAASTDDQHDEHTHFFTDGDDYQIGYRYLPPSGPPISKTYTLAAVRAAPGAPSAEDFDAVTDFLVSYGDSAAGYVP
jgi:hypothetical protein